MLGALIPQNIKNSKIWLISSLHVSHHRKKYQGNPNGNLSTRFKIQKHHCSFSLINNLLKTFSSFQKQKEENRPLKPWNGYKHTGSRCGSFRSSNYQVFLHFWLLRVWVEALLTTQNPKKCFVSLQTFTLFFFW